MNLGSFSGGFLMIVLYSTTPSPDSPYALVTAPTFESKLKVLHFQLEFNQTVIDSFDSEVDSSNGLEKKHFEARHIFLLNLIETLCLAHEEEFSFDLPPSTAKQKNRGL